MQIQSLSLTHFGCWQNLSLGNLSTSLNVLHGPNEAGKTTVLHFLRSMFYGQDLSVGSPFAAGNIQGENFPVGILGIETATGKYRIERTFHAPESFGERSLDRVVVESLATEDAESNETSAATLQVLLSGVDAAIYQNVFAFGLDEIESLSALGKTEAANYLYDLSAGVDRVSLARVFRSLNRERDALLDQSGRGEIARLLEEQVSLQRQREVVGEELGQYRSLVVERARLESKLEQLSSIIVEEQSRVKICDLATALRPSWEKMQQAIGAREALGELPELTEEDFVSLQQLQSKQDVLRQRSHSLQTRVAEAKDALAALPLRESMLADGSEIEILLAQREWIESRVARIDRLIGQVSPEEEQQALTQSLELGAQVQAAFPRLREQARALKDARAAVRRAEATARRHPLPGADEADEDYALQLEEIEKRSGELRRRIQLDQRLQQLRDTKQELDLQYEGLVERKVLSVRVLLVSGGLFAFGVMLALSGMFLLSVTTWGGALLTVAGLGGSVAGGWLKGLLQRAEDREWDAVERQRDLLATQQDQAEAECEQLDQQLTEGHGSHTVQLREIEKDKAAVAQKVARQQAEQAAATEAKDAAAAVAEAKTTYQEARREWHRSLHAEGLPAKLSPAALRRLAARCREEAEVENRSVALRAEAEAQQEELRATCTQVDAICEAAELTSPEQQGLSAGQLLLKKIDQLAVAWSEQQSLLAERKKLQGQRWGLARRVRRCRRQLVFLEEQRGESYEALGLSSADDLQEVADQCAAARKHEAEESTRKAEMVTACGTVCDVEDLLKELDGVTDDQLQRERERLGKQRKKTDEKMRELSEKRGRLGEQLLALGNDRRDAYLQLELSRVSARIATANSRWRDLVCTAQLLDSIRRAYEQQRQPAALQEASVYFEQMTEGRYRRVWTRLDREMLCVEDFQGNKLPASSLSRGTREPLMLALRMALVSQFARRGIRLPLVLDDVLVHFDAQRARVAVELLRDYAAAGPHQIFFFTCHKHLVNLFTEMGAEVRLLPETRASTDKAASDHSQAA